MANITTAELAVALDTDSRTARKFLRSITPKEEQPGKGARWQIDGTKKSLTTMKKNFDKWHTDQAEAAAKRAEAKAAENTAPAEVEDEVDLDS